MTKITLTALGQFLGRSRQWVGKLHKIAACYIPDYLEDVKQHSKKGDSQGRQLKGLTPYQGSVLLQLVHDLTGYPPTTTLPRTAIIPDGVDFDPAKYSKQNFKQERNTQCTLANLLPN